MRLVVPGTTVRLESPYMVGSCIMGAAGIKEGSSDGGGLVEAGLEIASRSIGRSHEPSMLMEGASRKESCCGATNDCEYTLAGGDGSLCD